MVIKILLICDKCGTQQPIAPTGLDINTIEKLMDGPIACSKCLITKDQRIRIGTLVMNTGLIKELKEYMFDRFHVHSTKDLTQDQAELLIEKLEADLCHIPQEYIANCR